MTTNDDSITRRHLLSLVAVSMTAFPTLGCTHDQESPMLNGEPLPDDATTKNTGGPIHGDFMRVHYLEIVTTDVESTCKLYSQLHGVTFGDPDHDLGGARTARVANGGTLGVRAPMHNGERSVTRAYVLVEDIEAAVAAVAKSGAEIAVPPMKIAGHGTCAIFFHGGIEAGLWQL